MNRLSVHFGKRRTGREGVVEYSEERRVRPCVEFPETRDDGWNNIPTHNYIRITSGVRLMQAGRVAPRVLEQA